MKKRVLYAVSAVFLLTITTAMTGCGGGGDNGSGKSTTETTTTTDQQTPPVNTSTTNTQDSQTPQAPQITPVPEQPNSGGVNPGTATPITNPTPPQPPEQPQAQTPPTQQTQPPIIQIANPTPTQQPTPVVNPTPVSQQPEQPTNPVATPVEPNSGNGQVIDEGQMMHVAFNGSTMEITLAAAGSRFLINGNSETVFGMRPIKEFFWNDSCVGWHELGAMANTAASYFPPSTIVISKINPGGIGNWSVVSRDDRELYVDLSYLSVSGIDYFIKDGQIYYGTAVIKDGSGKTIPNPEFRCP